MDGMVHVPVRAKGRQKVPSSDVENSVARRVMETEMRAGMSSDDAKMAETGRRQVWKLSGQIETGQRSGSLAA